MKKQKDEIFSTKHHSGLERPAIMVTVFDGSAHTQFRAYHWGKLNGLTFFDLVNDSRVELHNNPPYMIQLPSDGWTFDENHRYRELRKEESLVTLQ